MEQANGAVPSGDFVAAFGLCGGRRSIDCALPYNGAVSVASDRVVARGVRDREAETLLFTLLCGHVGHAVSTMVRDWPQAEQFEVDLTRCWGVHDDRLKRVAIEMPDGKWLTISMSEEIVGSAREGDYPRFVAALDGVMGDRFGVIKGPDPRVLPRFFLPVCLVAFAVILVLVGLVLMRRFAWFPW